MAAGASGVTGADRALSEPPPWPLARTLKVSGVPLVSPVMVAELSDPGTETLLTSLEPSNALTSKEATI